jgi:phosphogluconate dehydratase
LNALVDEDEWQTRVPVQMTEAQRNNNGHGIGRELFGGMRRNVHSAEEGAVTWL